MQYTLLTGATGFIGSALITRLLEKGKNVAVLSHNTLTTLPKEVVLVKGDILKPNLGISDNFDFKISALVHLAGIVNLGVDKSGMIWKTNVEGTKNVINFCTKYNIPHLFHCSTAYSSFQRNPYEQSKAVAELLVRNSDIPIKTIFKPSIVLGSAKYPEYGHFSQFATTFIRVHRRAEIIRRGAEDILRLPVIRPVFRVRGNGEGYLNLVKIDDVARKMASVDKPGTCWLTNPAPPKLSYLLKLIGEVALVEAIFVKDFHPNLIESQFNRLIRAFQPYLEGDNMPSDIEKCELTEEFLKWTINKQLERG